MSSGKHYEPECFRDKPLFGTIQRPFLNEEDVTILRKFVSVALRCKNETANDFYYFAVDEMIKERYDEASELYKKCLSSDPGHVLAGYAFSSLGYVLEKAGKLEEAVENLTKATETVDNDFISIFNLGVVLEKLNRVEESAEKFRKSIEIAGSPSEKIKGYLNLSAVLDRMDRHEEAVEIFHKGWLIYRNPTDLNF